MLDLVGSARAAEYFALARERYDTMRRRASGQAPPWTDDPIFSEWRFCCVHREHDKTTAWFRENIRSKPGTPVDHLRRALVFRWFNRIETGERIAKILIDGWSRKRVEKALRGVKPLFTGSYRIWSAPGDKLTAVLDDIDAALKAAKDLVKPWGDSLEVAHHHLLTLHGIGSFMAYEVVTDLRWTPLLSGAEDIDTWAAAGPGCAHGLGWMVRDDPEHFNYTARRDQEEMLVLMRDLLAMSRDPEHWPHTDHPWEMREVEHWLCEVYKYVRCRDAGQPPRNRFTSGRIASEVKR